jgi:hypothetical protein
MTNTESADKYADVCELLTEVAAVNGILIKGSISNTNKPRASEPLT